MFLPTCDQMETIPYRNSAGMCKDRPVGEKARMTDSKTQDQLAPRPAGRPVDERLYPRFQLDVEISVRIRGRARLRGRTVDISESGISAMLKLEIKIGTVAELEFELPLGKIFILAVARERNAFRYGFQFVDPDSTRELIRGNCKQLLPCS
jgi:hypothetical protein